MRTYILWDVLAKDLMTKKRNNNYTNGELLFPELAEPGASWKGKHFQF